MDWEGLKSQALGFWKKYRMVLLVLLAGLILMVLPNSEPKTVESQITVVQPQGVDESLEDILSRIKGAGKVEVLLTEYRGSETLYQTDEQTSAEASRQDTVTISESDRSETGLIRQINPPVYLGALIVCQGGDNPSVKLAIVEAVMDITGLSSDRITVLKMK